MAASLGAAFREAKTIYRGTGPRVAHEHEEHSIAIVTGGSTTTKIGGALLEAKAGQIVLIAAGVAHECRPIDPAAWGYTLFLVEPGRFAILDEILAGSATGALVLDLPASEAAALAELGRTPPAREAFARRIEERLAAALGRREPRPIEGRSGAAERSDPRLAAVEAFLRSAPERNPSLGELSRRAGIGKYELVRAFKAAYGLSPHAYLLNLRINAAKELLRSGLAPADAALAYGFCDQSHFTRAFSGRVGLGPAEYARTYKTWESASR